MTDGVVSKRIEEERIPGKRLGRHVEHDPRSRAFPFGAGVSPLQNVLHKRHGWPFNQGDLGSCTGNAACGAVNTEPLYLAHRKTLLYERDAISVYSLATRLDEWDGQYPPDDTGSSGLAAAKACQKRGVIGSYRHAFGIDEALSALQVTPVITGVNWYEGFDNPDENGVVKIAGQVRGGHEFEVVGYHPTEIPGADPMVQAINSWGRNWGKSGHFFFSVATWEQLLSEQGDVTVLMP